jgi:dihydroorotase
MSSLSHHPSRRTFLGVASGLAMSGALPRPARAFDLVVSGGHLIDPASGIDTPMDVGITAGRITQVSSRLDTAEARRVVDARGKIVTPGLVDSHVHVYDGVAQVGVQAEAVGLARGVTTLIDGGSAGATTFPGFREYVIRPSRTRVYALLNISKPGMTVPHELADLSWVDPEAAVRTIEANPDTIVGIKVRMLADIPGGGDLEVMRRTREAADAAGVPIVVHIGGQTSPLAQIFDMLQTGDVVTHALRSRGSIVRADGTVDPAVAESLARGVHFDIGHGRGNLDFDTAEAALADGFQPTTISSDVHRGNVAGPVFDLPTTMSKFVLLGMSLPDVVRAATHTPAQLFDLPFGTLSEGSIADLTVLEHVEGSYDLVDSSGKRRTSSQRLVPYVTLLEGREQGSVTGAP